MTAVIWSVSLALGCCLLFTSADAAYCTHYATIGKSYNIPLEHSLKDNHRIFWSKGPTVVYDKKREKDSSYAVTKEGSLILPKVTSTDAGHYEWELVIQGRQQGSKKLFLCVLEAVSKPKVTFKCDDKARKVQFTCTGAQPDGVTYAWFEGGSVVANQHNQLLVRTSKQLKSDSFFCNVSNSASSELSDPVQSNCFKTATLSTVSPAPDEEGDGLLFGLDFWLMVGILAGGGGLVLVLIVATIICCTINRRKRRLRIKDEQELRLQWTTGTGTNQRPHNPQYINQRGHAHPQGHSPRPGAGPPQAPNQGPTRNSAGNTGPRPPKARQNRPRPPDPITGQPLPGPRRLPETEKTQIPMDDEENPPPLPQPRKKVPRRTQKQ